MQPAMTSQMQAQIGVLFEREARDAKIDRRGPAEARRLQDIGARLRPTSGFDGDPFDPIRDHVGVVIEGATFYHTADPPIQPPPTPPPRPAIPWGPVRPPPPAPRPAEPPCPKC